MNIKDHVIINNNEHIRTGTIIAIEINYDNEEIFLIRLKDYPIAIWFFNHKYSIILEKY
ncbi:MAG: hypothetical protein FT671_01780 [Pantoea sp. Brub]|nr:hypothetical protein [Pantoea sp. Brub]